MSQKKIIYSSQEQENRLKNKKLSFSFEYYDVGHKEYCISTWNENQIMKTLDRLKDISTKTFSEMWSGRRVYHFGQVHWERTIHKNGFNNISANRLAAFHFSLLGVNKQLARVYGAYSQGVFYIVWFDLYHIIWPSPLKNK